MRKTFLFAPQDPPQERGGLWCSFFCFLVFTLFLERSSVTRDYSYLLSPYHKRRSSPLRANHFPRHEMWRKENEATRLYVGYGQEGRRRVRKVRPFVQVAQYRPNLKKKEQQAAGQRACCWLTFRDFWLCVFLQFPDKYNMIWMDAPLRSHTDQFHHAPWQQRPKGSVHRRRENKGFSGSTPSPSPNDVTIALNIACK